MEICYVKELHYIIGIILHSWKYVTLSELHHVTGVIFDGNT